VMSALTVPGTSLDESDAIGRRIEEILLAHPAVRRPPAAPAAPSWTSTPRAPTPPRSTCASTWRARLRRGAGGAPAASRPCPARRSRSGSPSATASTTCCRAPGRASPSTSSARTSTSSGAGRRSRRRRRRRGHVDVAVEQQADVPQVRIAMNRAAMARYGVTPAHLAEAIDVAFAGEAVSRCWRSSGASTWWCASIPVRGSLDAVRQRPHRHARGRSGPAVHAGRRPVRPSGRTRSPGRTCSGRSSCRRTWPGATWAAWWRTSGPAWPLGVTPPGYYVEYGGQFESAEEATRPSPCSRSSRWPPSSCSSSWSSAPRARRCS
jgi:copper/silver efflux system protein